MNIPVLPSDAGVLVDPIKAPGLRDWVNFVTLGLHSAAIGALAAIRGGLR